MVPSMARLVPWGFKFSPKDDELVEHYLLRRLRGQSLPCDGVIVEADPLSGPPWKLLEDYELEEDGFFFAAGKARSSKDSRQQRTCVGGGCWKGQKRKKTDSDVGGCEKLVVPGTGEVISWRKYLLNFHAHGEKGSSGWVMDEYAITAPTDLASNSIMAYHIRFTGHGKNSKKRTREESETQDSVADDEAAATPLPVRPRVVPEAAPSEAEQASSCAMDSAAAIFQSQESTQEQEPLLSAEDLNSLPVEEWDGAELDELFDFISETLE